ncbi:cation diffusion facilitator family transporter [Rhodospirillaceae bacterium AH-315-P19]|nr:cation diffusion facilitator family transporter [Rhodospirillaceae bacterium AH-315-P19]
MRRATVAAVAVAVLLVVVKMAAWWLTDSVSLLSSLVDSMLDVGASLVNLLAVRHALQPADYEHRFGHGKAEHLAGLGQAAFVVGAAVFLLIEASHRLVHPRAVEHSEIGIAVMLFAIVVTFALVHFQRRVVRKTGSVAIAADSLHYTGDVLINASVILSLILGSYFGWGFVDPLFGALIALYLLRTAGKIAVLSLDPLMDHELPEEDRARIRKIVRTHLEVKNLHDLRTRKSGITTFIQLHLELDGEMTLRHAHDVADEVEKNLAEAFPGAEIIIHEDPDGVDENQSSYPSRRRAPGKFLQVLLGLPKG